MVISGYTGQMVACLQAYTYLGCLWNMCSFLEKECQRLILKKGLKKEKLMGWEWENKINTKFLKIIRDCCFKIISLAENSGANYYTEKRIITKDQSLICLLGSQVG